MAHPDTTPFSSSHAVSWGGDGTLWESLLSVIFMTPKQSHLTSLVSLMPKGTPSLFAEFTNASNHSIFHLTIIVGRFP